MSTTTFCALEHLATLRVSLASRHILNGALAGRCLADHLVLMVFVTPFDEIMILNRAQCAVRAIAAAAAALLLRSTVPLGACSRRCALSIFAAWPLAAPRAPVLAAPPAVVVLAVRSERAVLVAGNLPTPGAAAVAGRPSSWTNS